jgi:hypothetical protein
LSRKSWRRYGFFSTLLIFVIWLSERSTHSRAAGGSKSSICVNLLLLAFNFKRCFNELRGASVVRPLQDKSITCR